MAANAASGRGMKFAMKEALVMTLSDGTFGREAHAASPRFVFYIDTDAEKIQVVDWYIRKLQTTDLFEGVTPFDGFITDFPNGCKALYFECNCPYVDGYADEERLFPIGNDVEKLALFQLIIDGELDTIFAGLHLKKVKARVAMDTEKVTEVLKTNLPAEIAGMIVASAVAED